MTWEEACTPYIKMVYLWKLEPMENWVYRHNNPNIIRKVREEE